jgi:tRNA threonylcarbamoyl adenosine modification protein YjeE
VSSAPSKTRTDFAESAEETMRLGGELAVRLRAGDLVFIRGALGAGKTTFVRGLLRRLGVVDDVRSPTFNLVHEYETAPPIAHVDLYRMETLKDVQSLGLQDYTLTHVLLIEWPEKLDDWLEPTIEVRIEFEGAGRRIAWLERER